MCLPSQCLFLFCLLFCNKSISMILCLLTWDSLSRECTGLNPCCSWQARTSSLLFVSHKFVPQIELWAQLMWFCHYRCKKKNQGPETLRFQVSSSKLKTRNDSPWPRAPLSPSVCSQPSFSMQQPFQTIFSLAFITWNFGKKDFHHSDDFQRQTLLLIYFWYLSGPVIIFMVSFNILKLFFLLEYLLAMEENL